MHSGTEVTPNLYLKEKEMSTSTSSSVRSKRGLIVLVVVILALAAYGLSTLGASDSNLGAQAFDAIWVRGDLSDAPKYFSANFAGHYAGLDDARGPQGVVNSYQRYHTAFPDLAYVVDQTVVKNEKTAIIWHATGTHKGELFGVAPTEKSVTIKGVTVYSQSDGKIVSENQYWHSPELLYALGVTPDSGLQAAMTSAETSYDPTSIAVHNLIGITEALNQAGRTYSELQQANLNLVSTFVEEECAAEEVAMFDPNDYFAPNFVEHATFPQSQQNGFSASQGVAQLMATISRVFPSALYIDDMFAAGDFVVVQNTLDTTQQLTFFGVEPGDSFLSGRVDVMRIEDGRIVEHWAGDDLALFASLGMVKIGSN